MSDPTGGNSRGSGRRRSVDTRANTAIRFPPDLHERIRQASDAFGLPMNFLVNYAVQEFLDHMIEPSEFRLTRRPGRSE